MTQSSEEVRDLYTIPLSSSWFQWDEIHETERRSLPEFFDGSSYSKNPRVYREYRDFIISKFREDPSRRLTFTEVRKSLIGDVGSVRRVFQWLERWGLINFGVEGGAKEETGGGGAEVVAEEGVPAGVRVVPARAVVGGTVVVGGVGGENGFRLPPLTSYGDAFGDWMPRKGPVCGVCGDQCDGGGWKHMKGGYAICSNCFENKNIKEEKSAEDVKPNNHVDGSGNHVTSTWTDAETLLLLEAVLKHGDDWDLIAQHVRTKNKLDCIARLIYLPFGEHILGASSHKLVCRNSSNEATKFNSAQHVSKEHSEEPLGADDEQQVDSNEKEEVAEASSPTRPPKRRCLPSLADATDSLTKQVAFLSTVVGPQVAAAAAEAAVTALCHENPCAQKAFQIDENEVTNECGLTGSEDGPESDPKVEDWNVKRQKEADTQEPILEKNFGAKTFRMRAAIATSLGAAAARAKLLADQEEREMELLMATIIDTQLRKIRIKMKHFEELEVIMEKEYTQIQQLKESIIEDWIVILEQSFHAGIPRWRDPGFPKSLLNTAL